PRHRQGAPTPASDQPREPLRSSTSETGGMARRRPPRVRRLYAPPARNRWRRRLIGAPLTTGAADEELLPRRLAFPLFASDVLSSVAYATEAALVVLLAASLTSYDLIVPIALAVAVLMAIVILSYRQTIAAYPAGGGAYTVAGENLGVAAGLVAAAALLVDYVLTVAVSVAAAVLAVTSAIPELEPARIEMALLLIALLAVINLRGVRESGRVVAVPVYGFVVLMSLTVLVGLGEALAGELERARVDDPTVAGLAAGVGAVVVLRAFASGASALSGVEALANGVPSFQHPQSRNAAATLALLGAVAIGLFVGVTVLAYEVRALPSESTSVVAQVAGAVWPSGGWTAPVFYAVQIFTFGILLLAANTAYQGFPRLVATMANRGAAPRWFQYVGDRLVFSNGVIALSVVAGLLVVGFDAQVAELVHLYLLGVFLAFTLSQAGMVRRWWVRRRSERPAALRGLALNGLGALATAAVVVVILTTRFLEGVWTVVIAIPVIVAISMAIQTHYRQVLESVRAPAPATMDPPAPGPVVVLIDHMDERAACATRAGILLAGDRPRRAVHVGPRDGWEALSRAWRREPTCDMPLDPLPAVYGDGPDAVAAHLRAIAAEAGAQVIAVLPRAPEGWGPRYVREVLSLRRLRRRLEREASVAVAGMPRSISGGWWEADRLVALVAMAKPYTPAMRGVAFAAGLGASETWAVHVAGSEREAQAAEGWRAEVPVHLEVVESAYRDLGPPIRAAVHDVTAADPTAVCVLVVPEVLVPGRVQRALHNQRTAILRRALADEERSVIVTLPYRVEV
ncbi:MAG TPA: APC family permease, partial [Miltoncostaeaceae bacterium]|nr:APC family permease [Miltoncostaeaceae bacterium]